MPKELTKASEEDQFVAHVQAASGLLAKMLFRAVAYQAAPQQQATAIAGDKSLSLSQACQCLGISRSTFYKRMRSDLDFPESFEVAPGIYRYSLADLEAYIARQKEGR